MAELLVGLENNQKILIPTSSEARSGNPLGTILAIHSNVVPYGYLPCNGVAFDENQYPALYAMLGTNKTPDTPCDLGADWDNKQAITFTNNTWTATENGWIVGYYVASDPNIDIFMSVNNVKVAQANTSAFSDVQIRIDKGDVITFSSTPLARTFNFVPFKKYAHVVIKATSGLEETQQDYVLQSLLEADSYSTEEVATGKRWIDGKMIYSKVIPFFRNSSLLSSWTGMVNNEYANSAIPSNIDFCKSWAYSKRTDGWIDTITSISQGQGTLGLVVHKSLQKIWAIFPTTIQDADIVILYTKAN